MIVLHDAASGSISPLEPIRPGFVSMYVCGPTVYAPPHVGHGRMTLVFDVLRRYLIWSGYDVRFVSNVTDIDDNIINRAAAEGRTWQEVVADAEAVWFQAMDSLGVMRPDETPHATEYVDQMVALISELVERDAAYQTSDGVYFRCATVDDYGLLARQSLDSLQAGSRIEVNDEKQSPLDFVLWKFAKPGEPMWPAPFGDGRPGWHTECVVMSTDLLGSEFDIHGGGMDLRFPHHENERAQAKACGHAFAHHWMHNGFVEMGGEKMSKSIGNVMNLVELTEAHDPRAYRMVVLQAHYRSPVEVTVGVVEAAEATLARLDSLVRRARAAGLDDEATADAVRLDAFRERMDDDLDTPGAMSVLFGAVTEANRQLDEGDLPAASGSVASVLSMARAVGLVLGEQAADAPAAIVALAAERDAARAAKDWARADEIRSSLAAEGWLIEDTPAGAVVRPASGGVE